MGNAERRGTKSSKGQQLRFNSVIRLKLVVIILSSNKHPDGLAHTPSAITVPFSVRLSSDLKVRIVESIDNVPAQL